MHINQISPSSLTRYIWQHSSESCSTGILNDCGRSPVPGTSPWMFGTTLGMPGETCECTPRSEGTARLGCMDAQYISGKRATEYKRSVENTSSWTCLTRRVPQPNPHPESGSRAVLAPFNGVNGYQAARMPEESAGQLMDFTPTQTSFLLVSSNMTAKER